MTCCDGPTATTDGDEGFGVGLGATDGRGVGRGVAFGAGRGVGFGVGRGVGFGVGRGVGFGVGFAVGEGDGDAEAEASGPTTTADGPRLANGLATPARTGGMVAEGEAAG